MVVMAKTPSLLLVEQQLVQLLVVVRKTPFRSVKISPVELFTVMVVLPLLMVLT